MKSVLGLSRSKFFYGIFLSLAITFSFISCSLDPITPFSGPVNPYSFQVADLEYARLLLEQAIQERDELENIGESRSNIYQFDQNDIDYADSLLQQAIYSETILHNMLSESDYSSLGNFISSQEQVNEGRTYWMNQREKVGSQDKPYWQTQHDLATQDQHQDWIDLCDHMINNLNLKIEMIDAVIEGLDYDKAILQGDSTESAAQIVERKIALERIRIDYYGDLIDLLNQAVDLELPDWSDLAYFIPSHDQIEEGMTYWLTEMDSTEIIRIPYWEEQRKLATNSEYQPWIDFCEHMIENLNLYFNLANESIDNLEFDLSFINSESLETLEDIIERKWNLASHKVEYYTDLIELIDEGMSLGTPEGAEHDERPIRLI